MYPVGNTSQTQTNQVQFGLSLPPVGSMMSEVGPKLAEFGSSLNTIPVSNIPGPPSSVYKDSFLYWKDKRQEEAKAAPDPQDSFQQTSVSPTAQTPTPQAPEEMENNAEKKIVPAMMDSVILSNSRPAIAGDLETARRYDNVTSGCEPVQNVSPN